MGRRMPLLLALAAGTAGAAPLAYPTPEALGEAFFHDVNLSGNRSQACVSCHDPDTAFTDPRETERGRAVSLGADGHSFGDRNTPSVAYAAFSPRFHRASDGTWRGGQFWDGRASDLAAQAGSPPVNPAEMAMADTGAVAERLKENPDYAAALTALYGAGALETPEGAYDAMTASLAAFEATTPFQTFDSKYDRWLRGEYRMTRQEELGRTLFFSGQFTNCHLCHQGAAAPMDPRETFTNHSYHNIGTPANPALDLPQDLGLGRTLGDPDQNGRMKVPSLRNVAVTGPYMHNGVFKDLRTVVAFYNRYNARSPARQMDPETGAPWALPEVPENLSLIELQTGPALDDRRLDAIVAFLRTLTDRRYEPLLEEAPDP